MHLYFCECSCSGASIHKSCRRHTLIISVLPLANAETAEYIHHRAAEMYINGTIKNKIGGEIDGLEGIHNGCSEVKSVRLVGVISDHVF